MPKGSMARYINAGTAKAAALLQRGQSISYLSLLEALLGSAPEISILTSFGGTLASRFISLPYGGVLIWFVRPHAKRKPSLEIAGRDTA